MLSDDSVHAINVTGGFDSVNYVDVRDSRLQTNGSIDFSGLNPPNSIDSGNNQGWFFIATNSIRGTLRPDIGATDASLNGKTVSLLLDGGNKVSTTTGNNLAGGGQDGEYLFSSLTLPAYAQLQVYIDDEIEK